MVARKKKSVKAKAKQPKRNPTKKRKASPKSKATSKPKGKSKAKAPKKYKYSYSYSRIRSFLWNTYRDDFANYKQTGYVTTDIWFILNQEFPTHKFTLEDVERIYKQQFFQQGIPDFGSDWAIEQQYYHLVAEDLFATLPKNLWIVSPMIFGKGYDLRGGIHYTDDDDKGQAKTYSYDDSCNGNIKRFVNYCNELCADISPEGKSDKINIFFKAKSNGKGEMVYKNIKQDRWEIELIICGREINEKGELVCVENSFGFVPVGQKDIEPPTKKYIEEEEQGEVEPEEEKISKTPQSRNRSLRLLKLKYKLKSKQTTKQATKEKKTAKTIETLKKSNIAKDKKIKALLKKKKQTTAKSKQSTVAKKQKQLQNKISLNMQRINQLKELKKMTRSKETKAMIEKKIKQILKSI